MAPSGVSKRARMLSNFSTQFYCTAHYIYSIFCSLLSSIKYGKYNMTEKSKRNMGYSEPDVSFKMITCGVVAVALTVT